MAIENVKRGKIGWKLLKIIRNQLNEFTNWTVIIECWRIFWPRMIPISFLFKDGQTVISFFNNLIRYRRETFHKFRSKRVARYKRSKYYPFDNKFWLVVLLRILNQDVLHCNPVSSLFLLIFISWNRIIHLSSRDLYRDLFKKQRDCLIQRLFQHLTTISMVEELVAMHFLWLLKTCNPK